ncbi:Cytochrome b561/ferric reductase transmembrane protein family [Euphorbia peplus]|nr:Cytochrome b561/ferric reductase transmembrane protein family [Euphorbia peplus]
MGEEEGKKRRVVVESLGWLTESSIMPKKHRAIDGVGASSILELKAQLYKSQEEARVSKQSNDVNYHRAKKKITPYNPLTAKNAGVESRDLKDKLELKAIKDGTNSYAALEKKAQLYDKLVRGELSDEEDSEKYCVDFFRKGVEVEESQQPQERRDTCASVASDGGSGEGDDSVLFSTKLVGPGRTAGAMDRDEHKHFVREVHEEANEAREKVSELKVRRQEQAAANREKLRQAYLRKKFEKLKAASTTEHT